MSNDHYDDEWEDHRSEGQRMWENFLYICTMPFVWFGAVVILVFIGVYWLLNNVSGHVLRWGAFWVVVALVVGGYFVFEWATRDRGYHPDGIAKQTPMRQFWNSVLGAFTWWDTRKREDELSKEAFDRTIALNEQAHRHAMADNRAQIDSLEYLEELRRDYGFRELRFKQRFDLKQQKRELERDYYKIDQEFRATSKKINAELIKNLLELVSDLIRWYASKRGETVTDRIQELIEIQDQVKRMRETGNYTAQDIRRVLDALMQEFARSR